MDLPTPAPLFNPITSDVLLSPTAVLAGPYGLIAFLPLVPVLLLLARWNRRAALILVGLLWLLPTLQAPTTIALLVWVVAAAGWVLALGALRRRGTLGRRAMIALVWLGLNALVIPLWWQAQPAWYRGISPMAALHNVGFAYFLLRFVAWGVELANNPRLPQRLMDTVCWILYPPCMRLGPLLLREQFLERFDAWDPRRSSAWTTGARRLGLFILGGVALAVVGRQIPVAGSGVTDFYAAPQDYTTGQLLRVFYLVPIQIYLLLWTYNQLALGLSLWVGICVDDNFNRLPLATSVRDFWHRWHITVGTWLRSYIYIPLGGSRRNALLNPLLVFGY